MKAVALPCPSRCGILWLHNIHPVRYMLSMRIPLTQGQETIFDDADWPLIAAHTWWAMRAPSGDYYAATKIRQPDGRRRVVQMQRLLLGDPPGRKVDHISRDTLDNRRENLRVATHSQNKTNSRLYRNNTTGLR